MRPISRLGLTFLGGFCDTVTFVKTGGVFSAHVTGNFVLFAAAAARGVQAQDYLKLATMPVFMIAVVAAAAVQVTARRGTPSRDSRAGLGRVLALMVLFLAGAGAASLLRPADTVTATLLVVFAMGLQNGLHPFHPGAMTTVMTGTVTNTLARITRSWLGDPPDAPRAGEVGTLALIAAFAAGCAVAAALAGPAGFACLIVAAALPALLWRLESHGPDVV